MWKLRQIQKRRDHSEVIAFEWFRFYGLLLNIPLNDVGKMPFGELCDLIACYQIKFEGAKVKHEADDEEMIPDWG